VRDTNKLFKEQVITKKRKKGINENKGLPGILS
jgi:hypothetical protein